MKQNKRRRRKYEVRKSTSLAFAFAFGLNFRRRRRRRKKKIHRKNENMQNFDENQCFFYLFPFVDLLWDPLFFLSA